MRIIFRIVTGLWAAVFIYAALMKLTWAGASIHQDTVLFLGMVNVFCFGVLAIVEAIDKRNLR